jgi:hypothetical protein
MALIYRPTSGSYDRVEIARPNSNLSNGAITFSNAYTSGWTSFDDGFNTNQIPLSGTWYMNGNGYTTAFASTNGYITFGSGSTGILSSPQQFNPCIGGNMGDQWLQPGLALTGGDTQGFWTWSGSFVNDGVTVFRTIIIANTGQYGSTATPRGYTMCLWSWGSQQFITVRLRGGSNATNATGSGPYNGSGSVAQQPSNTYPLVWRSTNNGVNWTYIGQGDVGITGPYLAQANQTVEGLVNNSWWVGHEFGAAGAGYNSDAATRSISYNGLAITPLFQTEYFRKIVGIPPQEPLNTVLGQTDPNTGRPYGDLNAGGSIDINDGVILSRMMALPTEISPVIADNRTVAARLGQRLRDVNFQLAAANGQIWVMGHGNMKTRYSPTNYGNFATTSIINGAITVYGSLSNSSGSSTFQNSPMWSKGWNAGIYVFGGAGSTTWQLPNAPVGVPWVAADSTNGGPNSNSASDWTGHGSVHCGIYQWNQFASAGTVRAQGLWQ